MIVTCKCNTGECLPDQWHDPVANLHSSTTFPLTVGRSYVVYALAMRNDQIWLFVDDDHGLYYPLSYPLALFDVTDDRVSTCWHIRQTPMNLDHKALLAIREWVVDDFFYDRLTDGETKEVQIFAKAKQFMDIEAQQNLRRS